jgi:2-dehydropantoate 2-reductase
MKQEFTQFALLGSGRVARHLQFYLKSLNLPVTLWSRNADPRFNSFADLDPVARLARTLQPASHVLLALSDRALPEFSQVGGAERVHVHFSGAAQIPGVFAAHPLMTFGEELEALEWYPQIPFIIDQGRSFADILPFFPNPHYPLPAEQRPLYHALCSLAGNSTFLLWKQIGDEFEKTLGLPRGLLSPFLHQVVANSSKYSDKNFTGPVARGDWPTVKSHLQSLDSKPGLKRAYESYLDSASAVGIQIPEALV